MNVPHCCVVELRQYTLHPGQRDVLIELFEREFIETQEAEGMQVLGQFRDLDRPDRFVWLRGFADMAARAQGLAAFYGGPVWQAHRDAANATMLDSDNVLLLRPAHAASGFARNGARRDAGEPGGGVITATIHALAEPAGFAEFFARAAMPLLHAAGIDVLASFVSETRANNFPRLPVREGERVFVWFARFASAAAHERSALALNGLPRWRDEVAPALARWQTAPPELLRLAPTARSLVRV
jgi:quinol monooxygenase YgiN